MFGARTYSDGKCEARMLPEFPEITKCKKCDTIFWISKAIEMGEYKSPFLEKIMGNTYAVPVDRAEFLTVYEYFKALNQKLAKTEEEELYIRRQIWWGFNDRVRKNEELFHSEADEILWMDNINQLINCLEDSGNHQKILIAELNRNLGNFQKSLDIIANIESSEHGWLKKVFKEKCAEKDTKVFELEYDETML